MKIFFYFIFCFLVYDNVDAQTKKESLSSNDISAIDAGYPLFLGKINFKDKTKIVQLSEEKRSKIGSIARSFYFNECSGDSSETYFSIKDVYFNTIQLQDSLNTWYIVLLKHMPGSQLNAKLLLYDNARKYFFSRDYDFNFSALYDVHEKRLAYSNLKKALDINWPDVELVEDEKNGMKKYKFQRLIHIGTHNHTEIRIVKILPGRIESDVTDRDL